MAWARRMDEGPNPDKNEDPGTRLDRFTPSELKNVCREFRRACEWRCSDIAIAKAGGQEQ
jgi:hypothetical protein